MCDTIFQIIISILWMVTKPNSSVFLLLLTPRLVLWYHPRGFKIFNMSYENIISFLTQTYNGPIFFKLSHFDIHTYYIMGLDCFNLVWVRLSCTFKYGGVGGSKIHTKKQVRTYARTIQRFLIVLIRVRVDFFHT